MPIGDAIHEPLATLGPPPGSLHACGGTTFVQEYKAVSGYAFRSSTPTLACLLDIWTVLLRSVDRLFL